MKLTENPTALCLICQAPDLYPGDECIDGVRCQLYDVWSAAVRQTLEDVAREADAYADERLAEAEGIHTTWVDAGRELAARYRAVAKELP